MQRSYLVALIAALAIVPATLAAVSCLDTNGNPVDWFFAYKMGSPVGDYGGYTYAYWDSNGVYFDNGNLNKSNAMMYTVNQMYSSNRSIGYVMYNDQSYDTTEQRDTGKPSNHEKDANGNPVAHQKGDLIFDGQTGVWLLHSVPGFPLSHKVRYDGYPYPHWVYIHSQAFFGQTFYCMSVDAATVDQLAGMLQYSYPWVYDSNLPTSLKSSFPQVQKLLAGNFFKTSTNGTFSTVGGVKHVVFQKNGYTDSDLYEDFVAPGLQTGLKTETWCGGLDGFQCMPSFCEGSAISNPSGPQKGHKKYKYDSINTQELKFADNLWFTNKYDHAKFAMAYNRGQAPAEKWFCPADINRMTSQRVRGGGAACSINPTLWDALDKIITKYDTACEK